MTQERRALWLGAIARTTATAALIAGVGACSDAASDPEAASALELPARQILEQHQAQREFPGAVMALHDPALGSALVCRPELLLVDELSLGLAPAIVEELMARLVQIRRDLGLTMVLVEQNAAAALAVADYGYVLENGRCVLDGDSARLRGHSDIQEFYLGQSQGGARASYRAVKQYRRSRRWYG